METMLDSLMMERWLVPTNLHHHTYLLGSRDRHATIRSQQQRALNLAWFLSRTGLQDPVVGIIGAGAGGSTLAVALDRLGIRSRLIDPSPLSRFAAADHRPVYPQLFEWPISAALGAWLQEFDPELIAAHGDRLWLHDRTAFPLMNWEAGNAADVSTKLRRQLDLAGAEHIERVESRLINVVERGNATVELRTEDGIDRPAVEIVVIAVGFGVEKSSPSYWQRDAITSAESQDRVAIVGTGDGALADVLRAAVGGFAYESLFRFLQEADSGQLAWLAETETSVHLTDSQTLTTRYLTCDVLDDELVDWFKKNFSGRKVDLVHSRGGAFSPSASPLHRWLLVHAYRGGVVELVDASVRSEAKEPPVDGYWLPDGRVARTPTQEDGRTIFVERLGPISPLDTDDALRKYGELSLPLRDSMRRVLSYPQAAKATANAWDFLRWPVYPRGAFGDREDALEPYDQVLGKEWHGSPARSETHFPGKPARAVAVPQSEIRSRPVEVVGDPNSDATSVVAARSDLLAMVTSLLPGAADARRFEHNVIALVARIFEGQLEAHGEQVRLADGSKRVDGVFRNVADSGFFRWIVEKAGRSAPFVMVECKNEVHGPDNPAVDQLVGRLSDDRGRVGLLLCRTSATAGLRGRLRDAARTGNVVLVLDDDRLTQLAKAETDHQITALMSGWYFQLVD